MRMKHAKTGSVVSVPDELASEMRGYVALGEMPDVDLDADDDDDTPADDTPEAPRPHNGASRDTWKAYAESRGIDAEALAGLSRDDMVALFPTD